MEAKVLDLQKTDKNSSIIEKVATMETDFSLIKRLNRKPEKSEVNGKNCAICSKTFLKNADLEKHMTEEHDTPKNFECTVCGKKFLLEWRLKKHAQMHTVIPRTCRYFSTKMPCPFDEIGCKFSHTILQQPATPQVDVYGHGEQPQLYHAAIHGHAQQPQPQLYHASLHGQGHAEQPQLYHAAPV